MIFCTISYPLKGGSQKTAPVSILVDVLGLSKFSIATNE